MFIFTTITLVQVHQLRNQSIVLSLREYVHENIPSDALIVIDPRIYRGINAWVFNDKHYLEGTSFPQLAQQIKTYSGRKDTVPLFYIECGKGTYCGWKPEDFANINQTGEELSNYFKTNLNKVGEVQAEHHFIIYKGQVDLPPSVYEAIDRSKVFWFYPVGWKYPEYAVDNYDKSGFAGILHYSGLVILYLDLLLALLSIPLVIWLGFRNRELEN